MYCELCDREITHNLSKHHLNPRSLSKKSDLAHLHIKCHQVLHLIFTNEDLNYQYNSIDKLKQDYTIQQYIQWSSFKSLGSLQKRKRGLRKSSIKRDLNYYLASQYQGA